MLNQNYGTQLIKIKLIGARPVFNHSINVNIRGDSQRVTTSIIGKLIFRKNETNNNNRVILNIDNKEIISILQPKQFETISISFGNGENRLFLAPYDVFAIQRLDDFNSFGLINRSTNNINNYNSFINEILFYSLEKQLNIDVNNNNIFLVTSDDVTDTITFRGIVDVIRNDWWISSTSFSEKETGYMEWINGTQESSTQKLNLYIYEGYFKEQLGSERKILNFNVFAHQMTVLRILDIYIGRCRHIETTGGCVKYEALEPEKIKNYRDSRWFKKNGIRNVSRPDNNTERFDLYITLYNVSDSTAIDIEYNI